MLGHRMSLHPGQVGEYMLLSFAGHVFTSLYAMTVHPVRISEGERRYCLYPRVEMWVTWFFVRSRKEGLTVITTDHCSMLDYMGMGSDSVIIIHMGVRASLRICIYAVSLIDLSHHSTGNVRRQASSTSTVQGELYYACTGRCQGASRTRE